MRLFILLFVTIHAHAQTPVNKESPVEATKHRAERGDGKAIYEVGYFYERGTGGASQDFNEAVKWYCKNRPLSKNSQNTTPSMLRLEKIAESDPEVDDATKAEIIYCDQGKMPKPSLELYSPLKVSWCGPVDREKVKDCTWFKARHDKYGQPLDPGAIAEVALSDLPPMSKSRDWYLDLAWKFGIYGGSVSPYKWSQHKNELVPEDETQRPHYHLQIKTKHLGKIIKREKNGTFSIPYDEPDWDGGSLKLLLSIKNPALKDCLERGINGHFQETTILLRKSLYQDKKHGQVVDLKLIKTCYGK